MVSEQPLPDRCGDRVTDKVGLEIHVLADGDGEKAGAYTITDDQIERVRLVDPDTSTAIEGPPVYNELQEYLWDDYELASVGVDGDRWTPTETPLDEHMHAGSAIDVDALVDDNSGSYQWYRPASTLDVQKITNRRAELQGFCERYPMDNGHCYVHQPGDGAQEGNTNAMEHGLFAKRTNFYSQLDGEEKGFVEAMVDKWIEMSDYERSNQAIVNELYRVAIDQLRAWYGIEEFAGEDGLTKEQEVYEDGEVREVVDEHPANLPYSRLDGDIQSRLKELGIYDSPESQQADATESLAQKLSGLTDNE